MKNGLIVYLVGEGQLPEGFDMNAATQSLGYHCDRVEMVAAHQGFFTVEDAWYFLATRGCGRISLMVAEAGEEGGRLRPLQNAVRLCG